MRRHTHFHIASSKQLHHQSEDVMKYFFYKYEFIESLKYTTTTVISKVLKCRWLNIYFVIYFSP